MSTPKKRAQWPRVKTVSDGVWHQEEIDSGMRVERRVHAGPVPPTRALLRDSDVPPVEGFKTDRGLIAQIHKRLEQSVARFEGIPADLLDEASRVQRTYLGVLQAYERQDMELAVWLAFHAGVDQGRFSDRLQFEGLVQNGRAQWEGHKVRRGRLIEKSAPWYLSKVKGWRSMSRSRCRLAIVQQFGVEFPEETVKSAIARLRKLGVK